MTTHLTEADLQRTVLDMARWHGLLAFHSTDPRRDTCAGFPDLVLLGSRIAYVELKTEKGRVRPDQRIWLDRLIGAGQTVYVVRHRQLLNALDQQLKTHRPLGRDGVHGSLHTRTCGCVDKPRWWWLR